MKNLKEIISEVLKNQSIANYEISYVNDFVSNNETVEDMSASALMYLCIPFLIGHQKRTVDELIRYCEEIEFYKIVDDRLIHIRSNVCKNMGFERNDKIFVYEKKQKFLSYGVQWNLKSWVLSLLEYFYVKALEEIYHINLENKIKNFSKVPEKEPIKPLKVLQLTEKELRKDIFTNRNSPTMSLDEFAEIMMKNLAEVEKRNKNNQSNDKPEVKVTTLEEFRKMDEFKDELRKGNTYRRS